MAQVITASLAMFIEKEQGASLPDYITEDDNAESDSQRLQQTVGPGEVWYGSAGEKPHTLSASRPSPNFATFNEYVLRAMAASLGIPYEVLAKDFSKTNYSSARAALLEAWRVYMLYRSWITRHYCQPIWSMVIEEAYLSGLLQLPAGAPDFYDAMFLYTQAIWIGPSRGYVDPVKEINATVTALEHRLITYTDALAERGQDFDDVMDKREEEEKRLAELNIQSAPVIPVVPEVNKVKDVTHASI